jgi:DNA-binding FadR family transcriptional regulator
VDPLASKLSNLNGQVIELLALRILRGDYAPGHVLPNEKELHKSLGVSRTTLREAIKTLSSKGLVSVGPSVGTRVRPALDWNLLDPDMMHWRLQLGATPKLIQDMYELRECFEPAASRFAAERGSAEEHSAIWQAYLGLAASQDAGIEASVEADVRFHMTILRCSKNDLLSSFGRVIESTLEASFQIARERKALSEDDIAQHGAIAKAIVKRDGASAKRLTEKLLNSSKAVQVEAVSRTLAEPPAPPAEPRIRGF